MLKRKATDISSTKAKQAKLSNSTSSSLEPWELVLNDGREAVKQNDFQRAVQLFTRALELKPNHPTLLEFRAASYEKLNQLSLALQDATTMIRNEPQGARGYLRAGKILCLQKKHKNAVTLCKRALSNVDPNDAKFHKIKDMMVAAEKVLHPPQAHDPLKVLPYDILSNIFSMLSFERRIQCTSVSQSWRSFALNWPGMWRDLDFSNKKVSFAIIEKYLGYAKGRHVRRFTMKTANRNKMEKILKLLIDENCQYVEILEFTDCDIPVTIFLRMLRLVGKHITTLNLTMSTLDLNTIITGVLPQCPKLTHLAAAFLKSDVINQSNVATENEGQHIKLTHLCLSINDTDSAKWLLRRCQKLQLLDLYTDDLCYNDIAEEISSLDNLKNLSIYKQTSAISSRWPVTTEQHSTKKEQQESGLESFHINNDPSFTGLMLQKLLEKSSKTLRQLTVQNCNPLDVPLAGIVASLALPCLEKLEIHCMDEPSLRAIISACPTIQELTLNRTTAVTDSIMDDIALKTESLKVLSIVSCTNVTGAGLQKVVQAHSSTLERLAISHCNRISADAINWAKNVLGHRVLIARFNVER